MGNAFEAGAEARSIMSSNASSSEVLKGRRPKTERYGTMLAIINHSFVDCPEAVSGTSLDTPVMPRCDCSKQHYSDFLSVIVSSNMSQIDLDLACYGLVFSPTRHAPPFYAKKYANLVQGIQIEVPVRRPRYTHAPSPFIMCSRPSIMLRAPWTTRTFRKNRIRRKTPYTGRDNACRTAAPFPT